MPQEPEEGDLGTDMASLVMLLWMIVVDGRVSLA
jgi:hypothetical protein